MDQNQDPPAGWPAPRRTAVRVLSAAFLTVVTAGLALAAVATAVTGDAVPAVVFGLSAVLGAHIAGIAISGLRSPRPADDVRVLGETDKGEKGLAFPYARGPYYWLSVTLALVVLLAGGFAAVVAAAGSVTGWIVAAIAGGFAVFTGWFLVVLLRLAPGTIVLTPTGIYHRSLVLEHFVPWDAVVDVQPREGRNPWITVRAMPTPGTRERRHTGRFVTFEGQALPFMIARSYWLGAHALPAYRALKFYVEHPGKRSALRSVDQAVR
ncbi:hypothetical protein [Jidongwangia harbinensis]|uniref:hypothetical protein n=1 Tax=Jidongwangia harbinensis TaxID=2878561 RepID=UPI001CD92295|nr:hypothetical protein [Jidongwangia harbinensis]MCA2216256.1 hypothetical protein [Jidongwangia harbinensis]MCA2216991.1 hypothetical protein [Jidongwangia harbinensis]